MTTLFESIEREPRLRLGTPVRLAAAATGLWRVLDAQGLIIGHLEAHLEGQGVRYGARRFHAASRTFRELGEFWSADDAVECLRLGR
ncbi:hypothetical protein [Microbacterium sp. SS28]|uniref:hypothetical protein n=1 Tax=Microbacterium sp. SS28 TaxID=2919948 RepID=UPI001FA9A3E3|nr:hypothetical protein [Microbacterium sp. SS28]